MNRLLEAHRRKNIFKSDENNPDERNPKRLSEIFFFFLILLFMATLVAYGGS